jgi:hypothetical protein
MRKTGMLLGALCLGASPVCATESIHAGKMTEAQLQEAVKAAPDDAVIEVHGQSKTKAEWRNEWLANNKPPDQAKSKQLADDQKVKFDAAAKALSDQQESAIAKENAAVEAEFETLKAR